MPTPVSPRRGKILSNHNLSPADGETSHPNLSPAGGEIQRGGSYSPLISVITRVSESCASPKSIIVFSL